MKINRRQRLGTYLIVLTMGCAPLTACAKPPLPNHKYEFSYTVSIDANGKPQVIDGRGKPLQVQRITGPVDAKKIVRVRNMTIIEVEGSHFLEIVIDGVPYKIPLED